jgi:hypothetical protein
VRDESQFPQVAEETFVTGSDSRDFLRR